MPTVPIKVSLDTGANVDLHVILYDQNGQKKRSQVAADGNLLKWQKKDNNDDFDITKLEPTGSGQSFSAQNTGGSGQWLSSTYQPTNADPSAEFEYTLTVTVTTPTGTKEYTTTKNSSELENDKPVIRN